MLCAGRTCFVCIGFLRTWDSNKRVCAILSRSRKPILNKWLLFSKMSNLQQGSSLSEIHIGREIKNVLRLQRRSVSWLAKQICCDRTNVYKIFAKSSIDTQLLMRVSKALSYDFFEYLSINFKEGEG